MIAMGTRLAAVVASVLLAPPWLAATELSVGDFDFNGPLGASGANRVTEEHVRDLRSPMPAVRQHAAAALGQAGDRWAVAPLVGALKDQDNNVRREAAKALGAIKDGGAVAPLIKTLGDADANVRLYAAYALGEIRDLQAAEPLLKALGDPQWCVRDQAAWALREIGGPQIVAPLVALLKEDDSDVEHLVWLLRQIEGAEAVGPLTDLLKDPNAPTRVRAARVLSELSEPAATGVLVQALDDASPDVRHSAVLALGKRNEVRAIGPLKDLAAREREPSVREAAEQVVVQLSRRGDLAAHWSFDDRNPQVAKDVTGRGSDGQIVGCTPVEGKVGAALRFGNRTYIELGKPSAVSVAGQPVTITAWVRSEAANGVVVARGGAFCGFSLYLKDGMPRFGIHCQRDGPTYIAAGREEVVGQWVHLAGVVRENSIELYANGKLVAAAKTSGYIPSNGGQGMEIGFDAGNSPAEITDHFQGILDEIKIFAAALSADEIAAECESAR